MCTLCCQGTSFVARISPVLCPLRCTLCEGLSSVPPAGAACPWALTARGLCSYGRLHYLCWVPGLCWHLTCPCWSEPLKAGLYGLLKSCTPCGSLPNAALSVFPLPASLFCSGPLCGAGVPLIGPCLLLFPLTLCRSSDHTPQPSPLLGAALFAAVSLVVVLSSQQDT